jgi:hypothetical protein
LCKRIPQSLDKLKFGGFPPSALIFLYEQGVRKFDLRVLVKHFHIRVGGCSVQVEVIFLDILTVVALKTCQTEKPLLKDRVVFVPQSDSKANILEPVAKPTQSVFVPTVSATASVVVREVIPDSPVWAVIFTHSPPGAFTEVRSPVFPVS